MKTIRYTLLLFLILFLTGACERDVDFKGKEPDSKIVFNSIVNSTSDQHTVKISESVFLFGDKKPQLVDDLTLKLSLNGEEIPLFFQEEKNSHKYYRFSAQIKSGDKLEVNGDSPKFGKIYAIDHVPISAEIKNVQTEWFTGEKDQISYLRTLITIKDKPNEKNYYRIVIRNKQINSSDMDEEEYTWDRQNVFVDQEILFNNIDGMLLEDEDAHKYRVFSDELIAGKEYTLNVYIQMDKTDPWGDMLKRYVKVEIHALSEDMFKYLRSLELALSNDDFSEPVKIYTNVKNGYGLLGAYSIAEKSIELPLIEE